MANSNFDFGGWASKNDVLCDDGTTIRKGCFSDQDGEDVPLVWSHNHDDPAQVLGHGVIEDRPEGTYFWGKFNDTEGGKAAKALVQNGDVKSLSVWANKLKRNGGDILHGVIREVSLVLSGSDNKARIDTVLAHGSDGEEEAILQNFGFGEMYIAHAAKDDAETENNKEDEKMAAEEKKSNAKTVKEIFDDFTPEQLDAISVAYQIMKDNEDKVEHSGEEDEEDEKVKKKEKEIEHASESEKTDKDEEDSVEDDETIEDIYNTFNKKQKDVVNFLVGKAVEDAEEESEMKHNVFDNANDYISHEAMNEFLKEAKDNKVSSIRAAWESNRDDVLAHDGIAGTDYGMKDVEFLFPEAKMVDNVPQFIQRNMDWVDGVLNATHRTPFSRVKSVFADITEDEARAKGYIKGNLKKDEVFTLLKRTTEPQTVIKKQRLDKDDINDITDFDVVAWMKTEMQMMLREEIARAILIGDGRSTASNDKIKEDKIRPVFNDADLYTVKYAVEVPGNATPEEKAKALIKAIIRSRKDYKGTGNPSFYTTEDELTEMLLLENGIGERLYKTEDEVRAAIRARQIITVEPMEGTKISISDGQGGGTTEYDFAGVLVNLADYNIGTNGGAKTDFFSDFDIDYNQEKYLYETRMSGALIKPYSAVSFYYKTK